MSLITKPLYILFRIFFCLGYFFISWIILLYLALMPKSRLKTIYAGMDKNEEAKRIESMRPFVKAGETILDVGAGSGRFGLKVQQALGVTVSGVDVVDYSDKTIPFHLYDGKTLPVADKSFDVVFFAFVLHHTTNQEQLISEAKRVARRQIIIFEDTYDYWFERLFVAWNDYHTNILQGWIKYLKGYMAGNPAGMPMPYTFRSVKGWKDFFTAQGLIVKSAECRKAGYKPLQKVTLCLEIL